MTCFVAKNSATEKTLCNCNMCINGQRCCAVLREAAHTTLGLEHLQTHAMRRQRDGFVQGHGHLRAANCEGLERVHRSSNAFLMTRATDRTTGRGFTDFEIANQVCCTCVHVLPLGLEMHPPGSLSCSLHTKARRTQ